MKKKYFLWSLLATMMVGLLSAGLSSCSKDEDPELSISSPTSMSINLQANGDGDKTITVSASHTDWSAEVSYINGSGWLTLGSQDGSSISFTVTENTTTSPRTAKVKIIATANASLNKEVTVTQAAGKRKTFSELILGTWNFTNEDDSIGITFFNNGTYNHFNYKKKHSGYSGYYKLTSDSIIFTIVQSKDITYSRSVKIKELSENSLTFEGFDSQIKPSSGIIYDGVYQGTREKDVDEKTAEKYRKDIIGDWKVTYYDHYGESNTSTLRIDENGNFIYYDETPSRGYNGIYGICGDKLLFLEDSQKCPIGTLYKISELTSNRFVFIDMDNDEIIGSK